MILKDECKKIGISVNELSDKSGTPIRTLRDWVKTNPKRVYCFLDAMRYRKSKVGDSALQEDLF